MNEVGSHDRYAIIFGFIFATMLTLGVVPILYSFFFGVKFKGFIYRNMKNAHNRVIY